MASNCITRNPKKIPMKQIENQLTDGFQQGDVLRQQGLSGMAKIKRTKLVNVRYERGRMEAKHGPDAVPTKKLDRKMVIEHKQLVQARAERDKTCATQLKRKDNQWLLHGHVRDADGFPVKKQQVGLYNNEQQSEKPIAMVTTNSKGYYKFEQSFDGQAGATAPSDNLQRQELYVAVQGKDGEVLQQECKPVNAAAGGLTYRDINLDSVTRTGKENYPTRLLGNIGTRELHDLNNEKKNCHINKMRLDHRIYFRTTGQAEKSGYDFCAQCFGKQKSKH